MNFQPLLPRSKTDMCMALMREVQRKACRSLTSDRGCPAGLWAQSRTGQGPPGDTRKESDFSSQKGQGRGQARGRGGKRELSNLKAKMKIKTNCNQENIFSFGNREKETKIGWGRKEDKKAGPQGLVQATLPDCDSPWNLLSSKAEWGEHTALHHGPDNEREHSEPAGPGASLQWRGLLMFKSEEQFRYLPKCLETNLHQRGRLNSYSTVKFLKKFLKTLFPHKASSKYLRYESNTLPSSPHHQHANTCFKLMPTELYLLSLPLCPLILSLVPFKVYPHLKGGNRQSWTPS